MTVFAHRDRSTLFESSARNSACRILVHGHSFEVNRIAAEFVSAQMIDLQPITDRAVKMLEYNSMH